MNDRFFIAEGLDEMNDSHEEFVFDTDQQFLDEESGDILQWNSLRRRGVKCENDSCVSPVSDPGTYCPDCEEFYDFMELLITDAKIQQEEYYKYHYGLS